MHVLMYTGVYIATLPDLTTPLIPIHGAVVAREVDRTETAWLDVVRWIREEAGLPSVPTDEDPYRALAESSEALDLTDPRIAASLATAVWAIDWLELLDSLAEQVVVR